VRKPIEYYQAQRRKGLKFSAFLHVLFLLLALFGLPSFLNSKPPEEPMVISVEILPIGTVTNVKTTPEQKSEEKKPVSKKEAPQVKLSEATPPPPPEPAAVPLPKKEEKKPEPKKEEPKKEEKKKAQPDPLDAVFKAVQQTAQQQKDTEKKEEKKADQNNPSQNQSSRFDENSPEMLTLVNLVMSQLANCWSFNIGAKDAENLKIPLRVEYNEDGTYRKVELADEARSRYDSDSFFRAAADAAIRSVKECSPLKNMPADRYKDWHLIDFDFNPKFMLHGG